MNFLLYKWENMYKNLKNIGHLHKKWYHVVRDKKRMPIKRQNKRMEWPSRKEMVLQ